MRASGQNIDDKIEPDRPEAPARPIGGTSTSDDKDITLATAVGQVGESVMITDAHSRIQADLENLGREDVVATRRIQLPNSAVLNHDIPIVATTAHALAGDREKCPASPPTMAFDREDFIERLMGNEDQARQIAGGFVDDMPRQITLLAQALNAHDGQLVRLAAHSIKGAAASIGGLEMREIASKLEQMGAAGDLIAAVATSSELSASFERAKSIIEKFCHEDGDNL